MLVGYRTGDMWAPKVDRTEALRVEALHFLQCIRENQSPLTNGESGLRVVQILQAADLSLKQDGRRIDLSSV